MSSFLSPPVVQPRLGRHSALFLDFDGTLVDLASQPENIVVPTTLMPLLSQLHAQLGGALAIVSGRPLADLDRFLAPLMLPTASEHGAHCRISASALAPAAPQVTLPDFAALAPDVFALAAQHPRLRLEVKTACIALHYRHAPELQALAQQVMQAVATRVPGLTLMAGKLVFELKPDNVSKGQAMQTLMTLPPFVDRQPLFFGDDVTDESGFAAVQALGGLGVKVGTGPTVALQRIAEPADVRAWLADCAASLTNSSFESLAP